MENEIIGELYRRYGKEIQFYLCALCRDGFMAEDLTQETFLKAILALQQDHENMRAWLYTVARNLFFNRMKKEGREVLHEETESRSDRIRNFENIAGAEEELIEKEQKRILYESISCLSADKKEVLIMQYFGGLSLKKIASVTGRTEANVKVLSFRGKRELRRILEVKGYEL